MNVKEFINHVFVDSIRDIQQKHGYHYISFVLISAGIEFLGACLDEDDWSVKNKSGPRFREAIKELFPNKYHQFNDSNSQYDLYSNLRCGMLHVVIPTNEIELIQINEIPDYGEHLDIVNVRGKDKLVLVCEHLYEDFAQACNEIIRRIDQKELTAQKNYNTVLVTE